MIPLVYPMLGDEEKKVVNEVIDSRILASGEYVAAFEAQCARQFKTNYAIAVSSGTTALHSALLACGIGPGDKVLTTPFSFIATANSILFCGAKPVFADIEDRSYNLSPSAAEAVLKKEKNIKAVLLVHLYGAPADMDSFMRLKRKYGFILIEDCAQAHGAKWRGRIVGSFGEASAFSYYATKNVMCGEGGVVHTNNGSINRKVRMLINHGRNKYSVHAALGYNFRLTNLAAGIGLVQLGHLKERNAARIENAKFFTKRLRRLDYLRLPEIHDHAEHVYHQFTVSVPSKLRSRFMDHLKVSGVGSGIYYPYAIYRLPFYRDLGYPSGLCPNAERAAKEVVSLPVHPALSKDDRETIADAAERFTRFA